PTRCKPTRRRPAGPLPPSKPPAGPAPPRRPVCAPGRCAAILPQTNLERENRPMSLHSWLRNLRPPLAPGRGQPKHLRRGRKRAPTHRPGLEVLEARLTPSFTPAGSYAVGPYSGVVLSADFNNDNFPDLATGNGDVLLGNGDGTFRLAP